jgi:hypothetical protein
MEMGDSPVKTETALQSDGCFHGNVVVKTNEGARSCGCSANAAACAVVTGVVQLSEFSLLTQRRNVSSAVALLKRVCLRNDEEERQ